MTQQMKQREEKWKSVAGELSRKGEGVGWGACRCRAGLPDWISHGAEQGHGVQWNQRGMNEKAV